MTSNTSVDSDWLPHLQSVVALIQTVIGEYGEFIDSNQREALNDKVRRAQEALRDQDQAVAQQLSNSLTHEVGNLGTAGYLCLVDHLMAEVDPTRAQMLTELSKRLRSAHKAQDTEEMQRLIGALEIIVRRVYESKRAATNDLEHYGGLLRESSFTSEPSGPGEGRPG